MEFRSKVQINADDIVVEIRGPKTTTLTEKYKFLSRKEIRKIWKRMLGKYGVAYESIIDLSLKLDLRLPKYKLNKFEILMEEIGKQCCKFEETLIRLNTKRAKKTKLWKRAKLENCEWKVEED